MILAPVWIFAGYTPITLSLPDGRVIHQALLGGIRSENVFTVKRGGRKLRVCLQFNPQRGRPGHVALSLTRMSNRLNPAWVSGEYTVPRSKRFVIAVPIIDPGVGKFAGDAIVIRSAP